MLALIYLGLAICVGERICGHFFRYISTAHRWATGTLIGILLTACFTYLVGRHVAGSSRPLLLADIVFFAAAAIFLAKCPSKREYVPIETRGSRSAASDWITLGLYGVLVCWMMFATLNFKDGRVEIGLNQWSDYGPNTAIVQNFAFGHNFPAEYPHFANEPIKYHFLFYFVAGNLEFLGLNLPWAENLVSIVTFLAMLAVVMAFAELLFRSRAVGILASFFFFFHGTFNFVPFLQREGNITWETIIQGKVTWEAIKKAGLAAYHLQSYLSSGYPYRGEDWGIWTQVVYVNQRHLASSIGIFVVVLIFLFDRYIDKAKQRELARAAARRARVVPEPTHGPSAALDRPTPVESYERVTESISENPIPTSSEVHTGEHVSSAPTTSDAIQAEHYPSSEATKELHHQANYPPATESHPSEIVTEALPDRVRDYAPGVEGQIHPPTMDREQSPIAPDRPIAENEPSKPAETFDRPFHLANYASPSEERTQDTVRDDKPLEPTAESNSTEVSPSHRTEPVHGVSDVTKDLPTGNGHSSDASRDDKQQLTPEPETSVVAEKGPSDRIESREDVSNFTGETSASETPTTFATRAYDEYMGLKAQPPPPDKVEEPAPEVPKESPQEPPTALVRRGPIEGLVYDAFVNGKGFIFCGLILGCLPYWNAPVFTAAAAVLAFLFVLFPYRRYMVWLAITAGVIALPQILALRAGNARSGASLIHWGYTLGAVPVTQALKYVWWSFGLKLVLILVALLFFSWRNLRLFVAMFSLFLITFCLQFSDENLANHKFLNIWLVLANMFVGYGLWRLWRLGRGIWSIPFKIICIALACPIVLGSAIDFFPLHNLNFIETNYTKDRLIDWIRAETKPNAVFVTDKFVNHPILLAGRKIFFGYTYFTWGAGYDLGKREPQYKMMFESKNAHQVFTLLKANKVDYVAYDNGVRGVFKNNNEQEVYVPNFRKAFDGGEDYWKLVIYKVPENADFVPSSGAEVKGVALLGVSAFDGGKGKENGQFDFPRGLAVDSAGNILIADSNNNRLQKFAPNGAFLSVIGKPGTGQGQFQQPGGLAIDSSGDIYVADVGNHRVQKLKPNGTFVAEWKGPEGGFYGPRDIAVARDDSVYVVDEGHGRIVKFDKDGNTLAVWGTIGATDGQFGDATSVAIDGKNNKVYVADPGNRRIQIFDTYGKFLGKWTVQEWQATGWSFQDLVVDPESERVYASSVGTDEVLVFDLAGNKIESLKPQPPDKLEGCSSLALTKGKIYALNTYGNRLSSIPVPAKQ